MYVPELDDENRILEAMRGQRPELERGWGPEFPSLVKYLSFATSQDFAWGRLRTVVRDRPVARTMVLTGERCTGEADDGSDSPILLGMAQVLELLAPHATKKPGLDRNGREPDALHVIFSGGQTLTRETGEYPGDVLADQFNELTRGEYVSYVQHESVSLNTGDQGAMLGGLVWARNPQRLVIVHVVDHIARFAATVLEGWRANRDGRVAQARDWLRSGVIEEAQFQALQRSWPELHLIPVGDFGDIDFRRGRNGISRAQEAFGPVQDDSEIIIPGKKLGGEYAANRYGAECLPELVVKSIGYACRALPPSQMLQILLTGRL